MTFLRSSAPVGNTVLFGLLVFFMEFSTSWETAISHYVHLLKADFLESSSYKLLSFVRDVLVFLMKIMLYEVFV